MVGHLEKCVSQKVGSAIGILEKCLRFFKKTQYICRIV